VRSEARARGARVAAGFAALAAAATAACALATAAGAAAPPSDVPARTTAAADSSLLIRVRAPDSTSAAGASVRDTVRVSLPPAVDFEEQRKRGDASLESALRGRRAALFMPLPLFGVATGALSVPDAGSRLRISPLGTVADVATDRTLLAAKAYGIGVWDLAAALDNPRADGAETLDLTALGRGLKPEPFDRAGALLAEPVAERVFTRVVPGEGRRERRAKSALYYSNGDAGILDTGARFVSPALGKGIGGSYARHEADGISPLHHLVSTRYALATGFPRALRHDLWVEGELFEGTVEDEADSTNPSTSAVETLLGRAEIASRSVTLHARAAGERRLSRLTLRAGEAKRTRVESDGWRERWEFPEWSLRWNGELGSARGWTSLASLQADSRRVEFATVGGRLFAPRREEARAGAGLRRALGRAGGMEATLAADWREASPTLLDGRLSTWGEGSRASGRIDLEWAHERPSWVDLLSPERVAIATPRSFLFTKMLRISRSGDPGLQPRRLAGALARGSYAVSRALVLAAEGSVRKLNDDFGWELYRLDTIDTLFVDTRAVRRGDGWVSHGAISLAFQPGPLRLRGLGWARGGPDRLSPRAGSPPRYGADAGAAVRVVLFQGDLPIELGFDLHAQGPRVGILREPGWATVDGSLHADFGPAGAFFEFDNVLDHRAPSALYDVVSDRAVPMPGRAFRFGVVWYLFD